MMKLLAAHIHIRLAIDSNEQKLRRFIFNSIREKRDKLWEALNFNLHSPTAYQQKQTEKGSTLGTNRG